MPAELYKKCNISFLPISILINNAIYKDTIDIKTDEIYEMIEKRSDIPKTPTTNIVEYFDFFKQFEDFEHVIHLSLRSKFSSAYQNARLAAQEFAHVIVIDPQNLSVEIGVLALNRPDD